MNPEATLHLTQILEKTVSSGKRSNIDVIGASLILELRDVGTMNVVFEVGLTANLVDY